MRTVVFSQLEQLVSDIVENQDNFEVVQPSPGEFYLKYDPASCAWKLNGAKDELEVEGYFWEDFITDDELFDDIYEALEERYLSGKELPSA